MTYMRNYQGATCLPAACRACRRLGMAMAFVLLFWPVARHAQTAQEGLDATFGGGGKVVTNTSKAFKRALDIALQRKGKIIVVGDSNGRKGQRASVGQYNQDGTLDSAFGEGGFVGIGSDFRIATAVAVQADGRIVVAGAVGPDFGLARLNRDGSLDLTFGKAGVVTTDFDSRNDAAWALALQPDGKMVIAGSAGRGHSEQFGLARYNPDGGLDPAFGDKGKVTVDFSASLSQALALALQPDGKIIAAGMAVGDATHNDFALVRLQADGHLDSTFGTGGLVTTDFAGGFDGATAVIIQPDGKIVAVGEADFKFALARYDANGQLDQAFGGGKVVTDFFGVSSSAGAAALQSDGKIIVAGGARRIDQNPTTDDFAVARYRADGTLDSTFGQGGKMTIDFLGDSDGAGSIAIQKDGKVIIGGLATTSDGRYAIALVRLMGQ
jgi:uncharacterized delta-60 repeat protein